MTSKVSVILGNGRCAEHMARILFSAGSRVAVVDGEPEFESRLRQKMKGDVQSRLPFVFPDDLRNQQELFEARLSRLQFAKDLSSIEGEVELIVDAGSDTRNFAQARQLYPKIPCASISGQRKEEPDQYAVELKLFEPLEATKIVEICAQPRTQKSALTKIREMLNKAGMLEINASEAEKANALIDDWRKNAEPLECLESDVENLFSGHSTDASAKRHTVMH